MSFQPFMKGWLLQKKELGVGASSWKKRYYVMKDDGLLVFERPRDAQPRKQISLCGAKVSRSSSKAQKFEFSIITPKRTYLFRASFDDELEEWVQALNSGIQYATTRTITSNGSAKIAQRPVYARHTDGSNPAHHNGNHFLDRYYIQNYLTNPLLVPANHSYYAQSHWQNNVNTDPALSHWRSNQALMSTSNSFGTLYTYIKRPPSWRVPNPRINAAAVHDRFDSVLLAGGMTSNYFELVTMNHSQVLGTDDVDYDYYHEPSESSSDGEDDDVRTDEQAFITARASIMGPTMAQQQAQRQARPPPLFSTTFPGFRQIDLYNNSTWSSGLYDELLYKYPTNKTEIVSKNIVKIPKVGALDESIRATMEQNRPEYFKKTPAATPMSIGATWVGEFCAIGTTDELIHVYKTPIINTTPFSLTTAQPGQSIKLSTPAPLPPKNSLTSHNPANLTPAPSTISPNNNTQGQILQASANNIEDHVYGGGVVKNHNFGDPKYQITLIHPYAQNANTFPLASDWSDYSLSGVSLCPRQSNLLLSTSHCNIALFDLTQGRPLTLSEVASSSPISCHAWSHSSTPKLAIANSRGSIKVLDTRILRSTSSPNKNGPNSADSDQNPILFHQHQAHQSTITAIANNPLFTTLWASAGLDGMINVWDERYDATPLLTFPVNQSGGIPTSLSWSTSHVDWLHVGSANGTISAYNLRTQPYHIANTTHVSRNSLTLVAPSRSLPMSAMTVDSAGTTGFMHYKPAFVDKYVWGSCPPEWFDANPDHSNISNPVQSEIYRIPGGDKANTEEDEDAWLQPYLGKNSQSVEDVGGVSHQAHGTSHAVGGIATILKKASNFDDPLGLKKRSSAGGGTDDDKSKAQFLTISRHAERFITRLMYIRDWSGAYSALCSVLDILWQRRQFAYTAELLKRLSARHSTETVGSMWGFWKPSFLIDQIGSATSSTNLNNRQSTGGPNSQSGQSPALVSSQKQGQSPSLKPLALPLNSSNDTNEFARTFSLLGETVLNDHSNSPGFNPINTGLPSNRKSSYPTLTLDSDRGFSTLSRADLNSSNKFQLVQTTPNLPSKNQNQPSTNALLTQQQQLQQKQLTLPHNVNEANGIFQLNGAGVRYNGADFGLTLQQDTIIYGPKTLSTKFVSVLHNLAVCSPPLKAVCLTQPISVHDRRIEFLKLRLMIHYFYQRNQWLNIYTLRKSLCNHLDFSGELLTRQETYNRMLQQQQRTMLIQQTKGGPNAKQVSKSSAPTTSTNNEVLRDSIQQSGYTGARVGTITENDGNNGHLAFLQDNYELSPEELRQLVDMDNANGQSSDTPKTLFNPLKFVAHGTKGVLSAGGNLVWQGLKAGSNLVGLTKQNKVALNSNDNALGGQSNNDRLQLLYSLRPVLDAGMLSKAVLAVVVYDHACAITMAIMIGETLKQTQQFSLFHSLALALLNPTVFYTNSPQFNYGVDSTAVYFKNKILQFQHSNYCSTCGLRYSLQAGAYFDPTRKRSTVNQLQTPSHLHNNLLSNRSLNGSNDGSHENDPNFLLTHHPSNSTVAGGTPNRALPQLTYQNKAHSELRRRLTLDSNLPALTHNPTPKNSNGQLVGFSHKANDISELSTSHHNAHPGNHRQAGRGGLNDLQLIQAPHSLVPFALDSASDDDDDGDNVDKLLPQNVEYTNLSQSTAPNVVSELGSALKKTRQPYTNLNSSRIGTIQEDSAAQHLTDDPFFNPAAEMNLQMTSLLQRMKSKQEKTRITAHKQDNDGEESIFSQAAGPQNTSPQANAKGQLSAQSMASNLVAPELKLKAQSSTERDLRNPKIVIEQLTFLLDIFKIIQQSEIPLQRAFAGNADSSTSGGGGGGGSGGKNQPDTIPEDALLHGPRFSVTSSTLSTGIQSSTDRKSPPGKYKDAISGDTQSIPSRFNQFLQHNEQIRQSVSGAHGTYLPQSLPPALLNLMQSDSPVARMYNNLIHSQNELALLHYLPSWQQIPLWNPYRRIFYTFDCSTCKCEQIKEENRRAQHLKAIESGITTTKTRVTSKKVVTQIGPDGKAVTAIIDIDRRSNPPTPKNASPRGWKKKSSLSLDIPSLDGFEGELDDEDADFDGSIMALIARGCAPLLNVAIEHPRNMLKQPRMPTTLSNKLANNLLNLIESRTPFDTRKQTILTALPFFLYLHVLAQLDRHESTIPAATRLISSFSGLPFAKALENRLDDLVQVAVEWLNTTCTANRYQLWDLGQLHNGARSLTSIISRSPSIPVLLEQNIPQLYRRLTGEIQEVLTYIATDPAYIPDGYKETEEDRANQRKFNRKNLRDDEDENTTQKASTLATMKTLVSIPLRKAKYVEAVNKANALASEISGLIKSGQDVVYTGAANWDTNGAKRPIVVYQQHYKGLLQMLSEFATKFSGQ